MGKIIDGEVSEQVDDNPEQALPVADTRQATEIEPNITYSEDWQDTTPEMVNKTSKI